MSARTHPSPELRELALLYGLEASYRDIFGKRQMASAESLLAVLSALGCGTGSGQDVHDALGERRLHSATGLEPVMVVWTGRPAKIILRLPASASGPARCVLKPETGETMCWDERLEDLPSVAPLPAGQLECSTAKRLAKVPSLTPGYYRLEVECGGKHFEALVIAAPYLCYQRPDREWGAFLPLYSLQSHASWGAGDFSDLSALYQAVHEMGGAAVATLPLFAAFLDEPADISPYMPASRLFWNELYVDPRRVPEFAECPEARALTQSSNWLEEIAQLRELPHADPPRLMKLKRGLLEQMAQWLEATGSPRYEALQRWVQGHELACDYANFRAVRERLRRPWSEWPQPMREGKLDPADAQPSARLYHLYVQWLAEEQMSLLQNGGRSPLYLDLPLGVHPHSYDVWRHQELFALDASAGAPPDTLFLKGQNWGFPPLHPQAIRRTGYAYLIASLRHLFAHAGWVRMDHVMGLHRLFWVPRGCEAREGVYVRYHPEEMYAILSLESHRSHTEVVGENLGTVPAAVNRAMERHGVQQLYVLQYEIRPRRRQPLRQPPANATASLNTHDMPPFAGFMGGGDLKVLQEIGLLNGPECAEQKAARKTLCKALAHFFGVPQGKGSPVSSGGAARLAHRSMEWLVGSRARMVLVNLEDLWGEPSAQNVPGTSTERPNWSRKARYSLEEFAALPQVRRTLLKLNRLRKSSDAPNSAAAPTSLARPKQKIA